MTSIRKQVDQAWDHRWSSEIEAVIRMFPEFRAEIGLPLFGTISEEFESEWSKQNLSSQDAILKSDALLLSASVLRLKGSLDQAKILQDHALTILMSGGLTGSFRFHFERGLLAFMSGKFLPAIEDFFSASRHTSNPIYRLLALSNTMFCLENLGIDSSGVAEEIELIRQNKSLHSHEVYRSNESQLRAYRMREAFRNGKMDAALSEVEEAGNLEVLDQPSYYARFLMLLPYTSAHRALSKTESTRLLSHPQSFFQKGFVIRTLLAQTNADDQAYVRLSDRIDRLYVWTWQWLNSPENFSSDRLMEAVNDVLTRLDFSETTLEDQVLLRNAMGWLGLADEAFKNQTRLVTQKLQKVSSSQFPMFEMEWAIIQLLNAKLQGHKIIFRDTLASLKKHTLWNSKEILISDLVKSIDTHPITTRILSGKMRTRTSQDKQIRIDMNSYVITDLQNQKKILSQPMCLAFHLLNEETTVSFSEFARIVFGLYQYESDIHQAKIYNLLARMKIIARNHLSFQVRGGMILCEGSYQSIEILNPSELSKHLRGESLGFYLTKGKVMGELVKKNIAFAKIRKKFGASPSFSREDVQHEADLTKSTANRVLEKLVKDKKIEKNGTGKNTFYRFKLVRIN